MMLAHVVLAALLSAPFVAAPLRAATDPQGGLAQPDAAQRPEPLPDETRSPIEETTEEPEQEEAASPGSLSLLPASQVLGRLVASSDGVEEGVVRYLMVDTDDGLARFVVAELASDKALVPIPWRAVAMDGGPSRSLVISATHERMMRAPRVAVEDLSDLTRPAAITELNDFFRPTRDATEERSRPVSAGGYLLIGEGMVTAVTGPGQIPSPRGVAVVKADGLPIGPIEEVVLDADRGRVSYVLVAHGQGAWLPIPFEPLQWRDGQRFALETSEGQLGQLPALSKEEAQTALDEQGVAEIYDQFGIEPYWQ